MNKNYHLEQDSDRYCQILIRLTMQQPWFLSRCCQSLLPLGGNNSEVEGGNGQILTLGKLPSAHPSAGKPVGWFPIILQVP